MSGIVVVYHNKTPLMLSLVVAEDLGYKGGESLTEVETWEAIVAQGAAGIAEATLALHRMEKS